MSAPVDPEDPRDRGARAILFDDEGRLVLIRRTRPDTEPYLVFPGGGVHARETWQDGVARECREELGAEILVGPVAWVAYSPEVVQRFFVCRLVAMDPALRTGHEFSAAESTEPWRGGYETVIAAPDDPALAELRPADLAETVREYAGFLRGEARSLTPHARDTAGPA